MSQSSSYHVLSSMDAEYVAALYARFLRDPGGVSKSWAEFFQTIGDDERDLLAEMAGASWTPPEEKLAVVLPRSDTEEVSKTEEKTAKPAKPVNGGAQVSGADLRQATMDSVHALMMIRAYRVRGHMLADLDPLGLQEKRYHSELDPKSYGFTAKDYDRPIFINNVLGRETATLREILDILKGTYCGRIGVEFMHIQDPEQKLWIQERIEGERNQTDFTVRGKKAILQRLTAAEGFEKFLHVKYTGTKRFGLDGGESLVPAIEQIMKRGGQLGIKEIILGMAHRGRLNVLANVMGKPYTAIFSEFQGNAAKPEDVEGSGDVKYHLGTSSNRDFDGNVVHLSLTANPSHLEAVNPLVAGKVRAKQDQRRDKERKQVMGLLLHGDAAIAGQGVVMETLMMSGLLGYGTGGTLHIVINNQIGFTASPEDTRSGMYCTDVAGMIQAPVFHVNADDPESVVHVARIAIEFRQEFGKDVFIDLICYRRHGHNEGDEPAFTQPLMYARIKDHPTVRTQYARQLEEEGVLEDGEADEIYDDFNRQLEIDFQQAENYKPSIDMLEGHWSGLKRAEQGARRGKTSLSETMLEPLAKALTTVPEDFNLNKKIARQLEEKRKMFESGKGFDWATAEAMAFGTLCMEGFPVRLSGQDCERGTFSQRHAVLIDQKTEDRYIPLNNIEGQKAPFKAWNSPLSEMGVLGFDYGYSMSEPNALVAWEAQFGDFVNGAQIIIDQFISSAEAKWLRMSGLVMLLPHGYEGQGPEHSSARLERFLQLCGEDNWQIVNCTTPANYFHVLRRQMKRDFRKPLVVFTPKSLLRKKECVSPIDMMMNGETFHRVLYEDTKLAANKDIRRVILCSGKVYYDLAEERDKRKIKDITVVRLEQLYPFPDDALSEELAKYPNADIIWCQEEPENMGGWTFVDRRIEAVLTKLKHKTRRPVYVGRSAAASPATGLLKHHLAEQAKIVDRALTFRDK
ncbi:MAG: 2-oxoglutarate dehydrogenase E1 component [Micavibrio sp.]|nr:MAG: 2-oxoglutarate dehydrogenase E1 component [Micavibrio sp.]